LPAELLTFLALLDSSPSHTHAPSSQVRLQLRERPGGWPQCRAGNPPTSAIVNRLQPPSITNKHPHRQQQESPVTCTPSLVHNCCSGPVLAPNALGKACWGCACCECQLLRANSLLMVGVACNASTTHCCCRTTL